MIKLGVSACLLGQDVRYDGKNKFIDLAKHFDPKIYELIAICPEVEMGMSIPRPPIHIINNKSIKLVQVDDHKIDFTEQMQLWYTTNQGRLSQFSGFILKSKSPSCGYQTTRHYGINNTYKNQDGFFVQLLTQEKKHIPIIDEYNLIQPYLLAEFKKSITQP